MSEITKKFSAVVLTLALALSVTVTGFAAEPTVADLQAQIAELQALIAQLKADLGGGTVVTPSGDVPAACAGVSFNRNISLGATGSDVKCLQAILNTDADTQVAAAGAGSKGLETEYFGGLTRAAVIKYQNKHAAEVLTPLGLTAGTGIVGVQTRAKLNASMAGGTVTPDEPGTTPSTPSGEEGYLKAKLLPVPTGVDVAWNASNEAVMAFEVEAKDSEIRIQRIDFNLSANSGSDYKVWRHINYLALYDGENAVKGVEINSSNIDKVDNANARLRITGLNILVPKNTKKELTVKVSVGYNPLGAGEDVRVNVMKDGIRGIDGAGLDQYAPTAIITRSFDIEDSETNAKVELKLNTNNPKEGFAITDEDELTEHELLRVDFNVTKNNVEIQDLTFDLKNGSGKAMIGSGTGSFDGVSSFKLYDGTTLIGNEVASTANGSSSVAFNDLDLNVKKGGTKTLSFRVVRNKAVAANPTPHLLAELASTGVTAVGEGDANATVTTDVVGEAIYFLAAIPEISNITEKVTQTSTTGKEFAVMIQFDVTAKGGDIVLTKITPTTTEPTTTIGLSSSVTIDGTAFTCIGDAKTIEKNKKYTVVVRSVVTADTRDQWTTFNVGGITFNVSKPAQTGYSVPAELLKDLKTEPFFIKFSV